MEKLSNETLLEHYYRKCIALCRQSEGYFREGIYDELATIEEMECIAEYLVDNRGFDWADIDEFECECFKRIDAADKRLA